MLSPVLSCGKPLNSCRTSSAVKESFLLFCGACRVLSASSTGFLSMRSFAWALRMIWNIMPRHLDACDWCVPSFVISRRKASTSEARMLLAALSQRPC